MAIGLVTGEDRKKAARLTKELHHWFKGEYGAPCCKIILQNHKKICPTLTANVARRVALMLEQEESA
jgi:pyruvate/oxaloacetate carboxyltransferase